jgi:hypothetical protein
MRIQIRHKLLLMSLPILITILATSVNAQGLFGMGLPGLPSFGQFHGGPFGVSSPGCSSDSGGCIFTSRVKAGYERLDFRFNVPIPEVPPFNGLEIIFPAAVDFKTKDANVWIGAVELELQMRETLGVFVNGEGAASRRVDVRDEQDPFQLPVEWKGSELEWWSIEGGGFYYFRPGYALVGGLRRSRLSLKLQDPSDVFGFYQGFLQVGYNDRYTADLLTDMWIPYIGIRMNGDNYKAELLYSPLSFVDVTLPFRYRFDIAFPTFGGPFAFQQERYSMDKVGTFVEASLDYYLRSGANYTLSLWAKGTYMNIRGKGFEDSTRQSPPPFFAGFSGSGSAHAQGSLNVSAISGGIAGLVTF